MAGKDDNSRNELVYFYEILTGRPAAGTNLWRRLAFINVSANGAKPAFHYSSIMAESLIENQ